MADGKDLPAWLELDSLRGGPWLVDGSLCQPALLEARYARKSGQPSAPNPRDRRTPTEKDLDRIHYSAFTRRLGGIAQIVSPTLTHSAIHNRLTHSFKVSLVAREIASDLLRVAQAEPTVCTLITALGGLDLSACAAAGLAHDIGHAPFAHAAELLLDSWLRETNGPASDEGFEGNAQSLRVIGQLDFRDQDAGWGLDLTAVTLAALLKYPYTRDGATDPQAPVVKFSVYAAQNELLLHARKAMPESYSGANNAPVAYQGSRRQSLECSIVDLADDITYATHDLQDFFETGLLDLPQVIGELDTVAAMLDSTGLAGVPASGTRRPLARDALKLNETHPGWFDEPTYIRALREVRSWLTQIREGIAAVDPDSEDAKALIQSRFSDVLGQVISTIEISRQEAWPEGPNVYPGKFQWHKVQIMKTLSKQYIIGSPTVSMHEQAQLSVLENLLQRLLKWCTSVPGLSQLPVRLRAYLVEMGLGDLALTDGSELRRAIVDYSCSLTDDECVDLQGRLTRLQNPIISKT